MSGDFLFLFSGGRGKLRFQENCQIFHLKGRWTFESLKSGAGRVGGGRAYLYCRLGDQYTFYAYVIEQKVHPPVRASAYNCILPQQMQAADCVSVGYE